MNPTPFRYRFAIGLAAAFLCMCVAAAGPLPAVQLAAQARTPALDVHAEAIKYQLLRQRDEHGQIPTNAWMTALQQKKRMRSNPQAWSLASALAGSPQKTGLSGPAPTWTWLGPGNIGGRVRSIVIHPTNPAILWAGSVGGGVWKSVNAGASWFPLDDLMVNLAIGSLVLDPGNPNVLYAGTGEGYYNGDSLRGAGIFKSSDAGSNWTQLASTTTADFFYVNRLAICPTNSLILLAATRTGIFRSTDAGVTWSRSSNAETMDLQFHPTDGSQCVASSPSGLAYYSTDGGLTWIAATGLPMGGRAEIAYAPSSPTTVYVSEDNNSGEIYRSTDGGQTYSRQSTGGGYLESQGWYDNVIWVDPTNPDTVIVGGIDLWRSTNAGVDLTKISQWFSAPRSAHADHHVIVSSPAFDGVNNRTVYFGNDGGIYRAADVYSVAVVNGWTELNNNLGITQFYGGAGNNQSGTIVGGTQDNGTLRFRTATGPEAWTTMFGGDGGFCAADPTDTNYFYGEYVGLTIHRSTDGGASANFIYQGIGDAGNRANFIAPFILDPNSPSTMLAGGISLWRSANVKDPNPAWAAIKPSTSTPISAIAVALGNSDTIWVGHNNGDLYVTANGTAASPSWSRISSAGLPRRYCTRLAIDPTNAARVFATFSGFSSNNVWRTTDGGTTWANAGAGLPSAPVNAIVIGPVDTNHLFIGTDIGVFASLDGGLTWSPGNTGPANVAVDDLFFMGNDSLIAVTHGRGCFAMTITYPPSIITEPQPASFTVLPGMPASFTVAAAGTAPLAYQWLLNGVPVPGATSSVYALASAQLVDAGAYSVVVTNFYGSVTSSNALLTVLPTVPLAFALNTSNLVWTTPANSPWFGQTTVSHDGVASARSFFIEDAQSTTLSTTVTGPGTLSFWWKVSSESGADILSFSTSGVALTNSMQISGAVDWNQQTLLLPAGVQTLRWTYSKDAQLSAGSDTAYLDQVSFISGATLPFIVTQPASQSVSPAAPAILSVAAGGTPALSYQWRFNGKDMAGATASAFTIPSPSPTAIGLYSVQVSNPYGSVLSSNAFLSVVPILLTGDNSLGQLNLSGLATNSVAVAAGSWHTLVLRNDGSVLAWGENFDGQCNVPTTLSNTIAIAAGGYHSLALKRDATVTGWGANYNHQAAPPAGLSNVVALAAGTWHSLALLANHTVVGWGDNTYGQTTVPAGLTNVTAIAAGGGHSLALRSDGSVVAWGENIDAAGNYIGQSSVPAGLANVVAIAAGEYHSLAIKADGSLVGWGDNSQGQLSPPFPLTNAVCAAGGGAHTVVLLANTTVVAFGNDWNGQCDFPSTLANVVAVAAGNAHSELLIGNPPSALQLLSPMRVGTQVSLLLSTVAGKNYSLQSNSSLGGGLWTTLSTLRGNGEPQLFIDLNATSPQRFYRVWIQ